MSQVNRRSVSFNPRNGSKRLCLTCARWEPSEPSQECAHPEIAILDVDDRYFTALQGLAEAAARSKIQHVTTLDGLASLVRTLEKSGSARVQAQHVKRSNVVSLRIAQSGVRV